MQKLSHIRLSFLIVGVFVLAAALTFALSGSIPTAQAGGSGWTCTYDKSETVATCTEIATGCMNIQEWNGEVWTITKAWCPSEFVAATCSIWMQDVGDAVEKGLIATDDYNGVLRIGTLNEDGTFTVVATISSYFMGLDTFQVPEAYRDSMYWFSMDGCGRWHGASELGLVSE